MFVMSNLAEGVQFPVAAGVRTRYREERQMFATYAEALFWEHRIRTSNYQKQE